MLERTLRKYTNLHIWNQLKLHIHLNLRNALSHFTSLIYFISPLILFLEHPQNSQVYEALFCMPYAHTPRTRFTLFRYNLVSTIRPPFHHFSLSCFRSGETSHIRSCKSNIYREDRWCIRRGDYRPQCLQASAHVRAHFGIDGRQRDNKAIRVRVREGYCNTRPNCLNYKRRGCIFNRVLFLEIWIAWKYISYHKYGRKYLNVEFFIKIYIILKMYSYFSCKKIWKRIH